VFRTVGDQCSLWESVLPEERLLGFRHEGPAELRAACAGGARRRGRSEKRLVRELLTATRIPAQASQSLWAIHRCRVTVVGMTAWLVFQLPKRRATMPHV
jgi:hypothetical protein